MGDRAARRALVGPWYRAAMGPRAGRMQTPADDLLSAGRQVRPHRVRRSNGRLAWPWHDLGWHSRVTARNRRGNETMPAHAIVAVDQTEVIAAWSTGAQQLFGHTPAQACG